MENQNLLANPQNPPTLILILLNHYYSNPTTDSSTANKQPTERERTYICGLGAKVGCEQVKRTFNLQRRKSQI